MANLPEQFSQRRCLRKIARKAIENESAMGVGVGESFADHAEHDGVIDQATRLHGVPGALAKFSAARYR